MTYIFTIDSVLPIAPKVLVHVIPTMERTQGLLGTLEVVFDWQALPVCPVFTINLTSPGLTWPDKVVALPTVPDAKYRHRDPLDPCRVARGSPSVWTRHQVFGAKEAIELGGDQNQNQDLFPFTES
jgi:hypothetical protein